MAMGLAAKGYVPFLATFAAFLTRAHDQFRMAAYSLSNIKVCGSHVGVSIGEDGPSQMGLEDLAQFRAIPGCVVFYPGDAFAAEACVEEAARHRGMCYIRTTRPATPLLYSKDEAFPIGGSKVLRRSESDAALIVAAGITLVEALKAYDALEKDGIEVRVLDAYSVQPLDAAGILKAAAEAGTGSSSSRTITRAGDWAKPSPRRWRERPPSSICASASSRARASPTSSWTPTASAPATSPPPSAACSEFG